MERTVKFVIVSVLLLIVVCVFISPLVDLNPTVPCASAAARTVLAIWLTLFAEFMAALLLVRFDLHPTRVGSDPIHHRAERLLELNCSRLC